MGEGLQIHIGCDQPDTVGSAQGETNRHQELMHIEQQASEGQDDHKEKDAVDALMRRAIDLESSALSHRLHPRHIFTGTGVHPDRVSLLHEQWHLHLEARLGGHLLGGPGGRITRIAGRRLTDL